MSAILTAVRIEHVTTYRFDRPVRLGAQTVRLHPSPTAWIEVRSHDLRTDPEPLRTATGSVGDDHGSGCDQVSTLHFDPSRAHERFTIEATTEVVPDPTHPAIAVDDLADDVATELAAVTERIDHVERRDAGVWEPAHTWSARQGSCRDSAWLLTSRLRERGHETRYVVGYLLGASTEGPEVDVVLHAWCDVHLADHGWVGLDTTSGRVTAEAHVPLVRAADPSGADVVRGSTSPCVVTLETSLRGTR